MKPKEGGIKWLQIEEWNAKRISYSLRKIRLIFSLGISIFASKINPLLFASATTSSIFLTPHSGSRDFRETLNCLKGYE